MAKVRESGNLSALKVKTAAPGRICDGRGLYLVTRADSKAWVFRYRDRVTSKLRDMGLGAVADVTLEDARKRRDELRAQLASGRDPMAERKLTKLNAALAHAKRMTFAQCRDSYIEAHGPSWRNGKHKAQWVSTLTNDAKLLSPLAVSDVSTDLVLKVLEPIWSSKTETATYLKA